MFHTYSGEINQLSIKPLEQCDLELLRRWRNDKSVSRFLRKIDYISSEQQKQWYEKYLEEDDYFWTISEGKKVIGALSIYNIKENTAEIGRIMIGDYSARGKGYGYLALISAMKIGFQLLDIKSFFLTVHEDNIPAIKTYEKAGFTIFKSIPFDSGGKEYCMELSKEEYYKSNPKNKDIVISSAIFSNLTG